MGLLDLLHRAVAGNPQAHFDQVVQKASPDELGAGLAAAMRSDQTPPFGDMVGKLFNVSSPAQKAGLVNQLLASLGPAAWSAAEGVLGHLFSPGQTQLTPEQASRLTPGQVTRIASHAEQAQPGVVDEVSRFYAQHAGLIKLIGGAALAVTLAKMKEHATQGQG